MGYCPECAKLTELYQRAWVVYDSESFRIQKLGRNADGATFDVAWDELQNARRVALAARRALTEHRNACPSKELAANPEPR